MLALPARAVLLRSLTGEVLEQALALGSVVPAVLSAGCCIAGRAGPVTAAAMGIMVAAMLDTMVLGSVVLSPMMWALALGGCALLTGGLRPLVPICLERGCHVAVMALLTATLSLSSAGMTSAPPRMPSGHMTSMARAMPNHLTAATANAPARVVFAVSIAIACGWAVFALARAWTCPGRLSRAERASGAVSVLVMTAMLSLV
jgi:hypothetical protein